jgi:hypothetical protein
MPCQGAIGDGEITGYNLLLMERSAQIRAFVYQVLRKPLPPYTAQLQELVRNVFQLAGEDFNGPNKTTIEDQVREIVWELTFQGIIVPGFDSGSQASLPWFKVTDWGERSLKLGEYLPYDATLFMERLREEVPEVDRLIALYTSEALKCFRFGAFIASAVMVGVAAEQMILLLKEAVSNSLDSAEKKAKFERQAIETSKRVHDAIWKRLEPVREQMPGGLGGAIGIELTSIFEIVRRTRNEAGHPTGRDIQRHEVEALLLLLPTHIKTVYALIAWLKITKV